MDQYKVKNMDEFANRRCIDLGGSCVSAQTRLSVLSTDQIRRQASNIRQYKKLLASPEASIRYAAVSEMLKSSDNGLRVLAFDMAFQSAESSIRALALKERILSMKLLVVEPESESVAAQLVDKRLSRVVIPLGKLISRRDFPRKTELPL